MGTAATGHAATKGAAGEAPSAAEATTAAANRNNYYRCAYLGNIEVAI
jgi:hypothetical protein